MKEPVKEGSVFSFVVGEDDPSVRSVAPAILTEVKQEFKLKVPETPVGFSVPDFRTIVNVIYTYYVTYKRKPEPKDVSARCGLSASYIQECMNTRQFKAAMDKRGIPWGEDVGLSAEQHLMLAHLTNPTDRRSVEAKFKAAGVHYAKFRAWMADPVFNATLRELSNNMIQDNLVNVDRALVQQAMKGNVPAIQLVYQVSGRYDPANQNQVEVAAVMNQVVELISECVKDPVILNKIGEGLANLAQRTGLQMKGNRQAIEGEILR